MKKRMRVFNKPLNLLCSFLIALTPIMLLDVSCFLVWGESECPDELKELYSSK